MNVYKQYCSLQYRSMCIYIFIQTLHMVFSPSYSVLLPYACPRTWNCDNDYRHLLEHVNFPVLVLPSDDYFIRTYLESKVQEAISFSSFFLFFFRTETTGKAKQLNEKFHSLNKSDYKDVQHKQCE
jgi:hypothetical protein